MVVKFSIVVCIALELKKFDIFGLKIFYNKKRRVLSGKYHQFDLTLFNTVAIPDQS